MTRRAANPFFPGIVLFLIVAIALIAIILLFAYTPKPEPVPEPVEIKVGQVWHYEPGNEDRRVLEVEGVWVTYRNLNEDVNVNEWPSVDRLMTSWFRMGAELRDGG